MHPPQLPVESQVNKHEEDLPEDRMPVDRPTTFKGQMNLDKFSFTAGVTSDLLTRPDAPSSTSEVRSKVKRNQRFNEPRSEDGRLDVRPSPLIRMTRAQAKASKSNLHTSTLTTTIPASPKPNTRSQTASPYPPPRVRNIIPSSKSRGRRRKDETVETPECFLRDSVAPGMILLMVGVNPGIMTGKTGFAYAHPTNQFWKLLHASGITDELHQASFTYDLPERYAVGNTNIVERPTRDASMLSRQEMHEGVPKLEQKIGDWKPDAVCLVGKGIWEAVFRAKTGRSLTKEEFKYGWQRQHNFRLGKRKGSDYEGAWVFVATTTSGVSTNFSFDEKVKIWKPLGDWTREMREERFKKANLAHRLNDHAVAP